MAKNLNLPLSSNLSIFLGLLSFFSLIFLRPLSIILRSYSLPTHYGFLFIIFFVLFIMIFFRISVLSFLTILGNYIFTRCFNLIYTFYSLELFLAKSFLGIPIIMLFNYIISNSRITMYKFPFLFFTVFLCIFLLLTINTLFFSFLFKYRVPSYEDSVYPSVEDNWIDFHQGCIQYLVFYLKFLREFVSEKSFFKNHFDILIELHYSYIKVEPGHRLGPYFDFLKFNLELKFFERGSICRKIMLMALTCLLALLLEQLLYIHVWV